MLQTGDVWFATLEEIALHVQACIAQGLYKPRVDHLPYYTGPQMPSRELTEAARRRGSWATD
jgi:hypothetical protein